MNNVIIQFFCIIFSYLLNNIIAVISLCIAIFTYLKNRKSLEVNFEDFFKIDNIVLNQIEFNKNFYCNIIKIVNPSSHDIAYFDLAIHDPHNEKIYTSFPFYTEKMVLVHGKKEKLFTYRIFNQKEDNILNLPYSNYGVFKSNSFTVINLATYFEDYLPKEIYVTFKVSIRSFVKIKGSIARSSYKLYRKRYILSEDKLTYYADGIKRYPVN